MALIPIAFAIPYAPFADVFGFVPLHGTLVGMIGLIAVLYVTATEVQKKWFYRGVE
jgi:Mg2+-importing ATPase